MKKLTFTAILIGVILILAWNSYTREGFASAKASCKKGKCTCPSGYAYDIVSKECKQSSSIQEPIAPKSRK